VAASGIVPIAATSGHFRVTEWVLQFGKRRSVATHALAVEPLELDADWLVVKGAGHYEHGCRPCHGAVESPPYVVRAMTPPPPHLPPQIASWSPEELFYIVDRGIKFTGMPGWPARGRDDEVRALVAFLLELPELDAREYDALVHGDADAMRVPAFVATCVRCHGSDGCGREVAAFPRLAGQPVDVLAEALRAYADDRRASGTMQPLTDRLDRDEMQRMAEWFADLPACAPRPTAASEDSIARGREIALHGVEIDRVPACEECHGTTEPAHHAAPMLAGQFADHLVIQLELFGRHARGGSEYAELMDTVAERMSPQQIRDVAAYYAQLGAPELARRERMLR
jgi:cytochrome c553